MQKSFWTIVEKTDGEIIEKKSRFIANVFHVTSEEEANERIAEVKKAHRDARHNVFVYRLSNGTERYTDDGEPSGTAGVPILDILRGEELLDVLVVVTRYFGGILLGTGGLVHCYSGACKLAMEKATKVKMNLCVEFKVNVNYDDYNLILYYCKNNGIKIIDSIFEERVEMNVLVEESYTQKFLHDLSEITNGNASFEKSCKYYHI